MQAPTKEQLKGFFDSSIWGYLRSIIIEGIEGYHIELENTDLDMLETAIIRGRVLTMRDVLAWEETIEDTIVEKEENDEWRNEERDQ